MKTMSSVEKATECCPSWDKGGKERLASVFAMEIGILAGIAGMLVIIISALISLAGPGVPLGIALLGLGALSGYGYVRFNKLEEQASTRDLMYLYLKERANGTEEDNPARPFPGDGKYSTFQYSPASRIGDTVYTVEGSGTKMEKYTEGPEDRKWMQDRDWNYLCRLKRENLLDRAEPNLVTESPGLYRAIMKAEVKPAPSSSSHQALLKQFNTGTDKHLKKNNANVVTKCVTPAQPSNSSKPDNDIELGNTSATVGYRI